MKNVLSSVTTNLLLIDWTNFVEICYTYKTNMITWICVVDKCNLNICVTFRNVLENQTKISCNIVPRTKAYKINLLEKTHCLMLSLHLTFSLQT